MKEGVIRPAKPSARDLVQRPVIDLTHIIAPTAANAVPLTPPQDAQVLAIGDSVMLGTSNYLRRNVAAIDVDAKLGRQVSAALTILRDRAAANMLTPVVIVHLGNNGTFSANQFNDMIPGRGLEQDGLHMLGGGTRNFASASAMRAGDALEDLTALMILYEIQQELGIMQ